MLFSPKQTGKIKGGKPLPEQNAILRQGQLTDLVAKCVPLRELAGQVRALAKALKHYLAT